MADQYLQSPINPHFFQPLLPGFLTHLNIPVAFFLKHVEGSNNQNKTVKLRTDASDKTWSVKIDGLKFTNGWEDFALAHDLRIGDIIVFRHEGGLLFHVTALGPSCCEIQYTSSSSHNIVAGNSSKRVKKNPRKRVESLSDHSRFVAHVSASSLRFDRLYLPISFARSNGLNKMSGKEIVLRNEEGRSWTLILKYNKVGMHTYVRPGWRRFCTENRMNKGQQCTFKLVHKSEPPILSLCRAEHRPQSESESSSDYSCFEGSVTPSSLKIDRLYFPRGFVTANGLDKGFSEIVLKNECGRRWTSVFKHYESVNHTVLKRGWTSFCQENGIKAGDSFKFKLVGTGQKPVLSLCPADSNRDKTPLKCPEGSKSKESEEENRLGEKSISEECLRKEKKKYWSRCRGSSSYSQNQFVTLTLTPYAFNSCKLILPMGFTKVNGINKPGNITLLGQDGVKRVVDLLQDKRNRTMRIGKGWREFCASQGVKMDESFVLELIWEEESNPVLKFCTKLNSV